ncbi:MAG: hypothetical protein LC799_24520 [Actinobacteria bacterium]|nr:hypothetical protein [Actinomycetota bacterium]
MTDSPSPGLSTPEDHTLERALDPHPRTPGATALAFSALNSMRRAASASRTSGRSAVGLRPILDPNASTRRAQNLAEQPKRKITPPSTRLDRPRSFRDDQPTPAEIHTIRLAWDNHAA